MSAVELSLVIACFNEQGHLLESVAEIERTLGAAGITHELLFIDDASSDGTAALIEGLVAGRDDRRAVYHTKNVGRGGTVSEGFRMARGRRVGYLDIDLEVHCRSVPKLLAELDAGADAATAYRRYDLHWRADSLLRHVLSRGYRLLLRTMLATRLRDTETGCKFFDREALLPILEEARHPGWFWDTEIMILAERRGLKIVEVPCRFEQRLDKRSTVRVFRDVPDYLVSLWTFRRRLSAPDAGRDNDSDRA